MRPLLQPPDLRHPSRRFRAPVLAPALGPVLALVLALVATPLLLVPANGAADGDRPTPLLTMTDPVNLGRLTERARIASRQRFQAKVAAQARKQQRARTRMLAADRERRPDPSLCTLPLCVGDPRLGSFARRGGVVRPVLFTARTGATLSGHVWTTRGGARRKPLVVMVNGSMIDFEQGHWPQAQALARAGYVVLTFDPQGEGLSDALGEGRDLLDSVGAGVPGTPHNGRPFYDGAVDALDFALSTPRHRYRPRPSRNSGTRHGAKQRRRVKAGLNAGYNPLWRRVDRRHVGLAGYSYGAVAASYVAQSDRRVDAVVAWDSLCYPVQPSPDEIAGLFLSNQTSLLPGVTVPLAAQIPRDCFGAPPGRAPKPHAPALGLSGDFVLPGLVQNTSRAGKTLASRRYSKHGVDSGQIVIQGADHVDFTFVGSLPVLPARLRALDLVVWYTDAWFDKYLRGDRSADRRLRTRRWRHDARTARVDPAGDGNLFSQLFASRLDIRLASGRRWRCEDLRDGCPGMSARDGEPQRFSYLAAARGA